MSGIREQIIKVLEEHEPARDDDNKLYAMILFNRVEHHSHQFPDEQREGAVKLLAMMYEGKLPNFDTIGRFRRKLQEKNEGLRGDKYNVRHSSTEEYKKKLQNTQWKI